MNLLILGLEVCNGGDESSMRVTTQTPTADPDAIFKSAELIDTSPGESKLAKELTKLTALNTFLSRLKHNPLAD